MKKIFLFSILCLAMLGIIKTSSVVVAEDSYLLWNDVNTWTSPNSVPLPYTKRNMQTTNMSVEILQGNGVIIPVSTNFYYGISPDDTQITLKIVGKSIRNTIVTDTQTININIPPIENPLYENQYFTIYKKNNFLLMRKKYNEVEVKLNWNNGGVIRNIIGLQGEKTLTFFNQVANKTITISEYSVKNLNGNTGWTTFTDGGSFVAQ